MRTSALIALTLPLAAAEPQAARPAARPANTASAGLAVLVMPLFIVGVIDTRHRDPRWNGEPARMSGRSSAAVGWPSGRWRWS